MARSVLGVGGRMPCLLLVTLGLLDLKLTIGDGTNQGREEARRLTQERREARRKEWEARRAASGKGVGSGKGRESSRGDSGGKRQSTAELAREQWQNRNAKGRDEALAEKFTAMRGMPGGADPIIVRAGMTELEGAEKGRKKGEAASTPDCSAFDTCLAGNKGKKPMECCKEIELPGAECHLCFLAGCYLRTYSCYGAEAAASGGYCEACFLLANMTRLDEDTPDPKEQMMTERLKRREEKKRESGASEDEIASMKQKMQEIMQWRKSKTSM